MSNRLALVGTLIVAMSAACPSVAAAQNPWRTDPQPNGQYMTPPAPTPAPDPLPTHSIPNMPKYAPLDGKLISEADSNNRYPAAGLPGAYPGGVFAPYGSGYGYGAPLGYGGLGYPGSGWGGLGPYNSWGSPYGGSGLWPGTGGWNGLGGPMSWMPFW